MVESVGLACAKCTKITNVDLDEAKGYTKETPFVCEKCLQEKPKEEPISSRLQESERYNHPNLIEQSHETKLDEPSPALKKDTITIKIPKLETLEDFEQAAVGQIKEKLDEFRHKREQAERDLQQEQTRVATYERGSRSHLIMGLVLSFVCVTMFLVIGTQILGNVTTITTSTNCASLPGNAGTHQTTSNTTSWALQCINNNTNIGNAFTLMTVIIIVVISITILFVIRMML